MLDIICSAGALSIALAWFLGPWLIIVWIDIIVCQPWDLDSKKDTNLGLMVAWEVSPWPTLVFNTTGVMAVPTLHACRCPHGLTPRAFTDNVICNHRTISAFIQQPAGVLNTCHQLNFGPRRMVFLLKCLPLISKLYFVGTGICLWKPRARKPTKHKEQILMTATCPDLEHACEDGLRWNQNAVPLQSPKMQCKRAQRQWS